MFSITSLFAAEELHVISHISTVDSGYSGSENEDYYLSGNVKTTGKGSIISQRMDNATFDSKHIHSNKIYKLTYINYSEVFKVSLPNYPRFTVIIHLHKTM